VRAGRGSAPFPVYACDFCVFVSVRVSVGLCSSPVPVVLECQGGFFSSFFVFVVGWSWGLLAVSSVCDGWVGGRRGSVFRVSFWCGIGFGFVPLFGANRVGDGRDLSSFRRMAWSSRVGCITPPPPSFKKPFSISFSGERAYFRLTGIFFLTEIYFSVLFYSGI